MRLHTVWSCCSHTSFRIYVVSLIESPAVPHSITTPALTLLPQGSLQMHCGHEMPYKGQDRPDVRKSVLRDEKRGYKKT